MTDKELNRTFIINKCDENELIFTECNKYLSNYATQYILEYRKLIEDFAYKNINHLKTHSTILLKVGRNYGLYI